MMTQQKNKNYWQKIAQEYDKNVGDKGDIRHEKIINPVVFELLGNLSGKTVLDAGCGNGYLSRKIAETARKVIGVDFTKELLDAAKQKDNPGNLEFIEENLVRLPFTSDIFDIILCNMVLMDVENIDKVIEEFGRVLKPDGIIVVSILHPCFENPPKTYSLFNDNKMRMGTVIQKYFEIGVIKDELNRINNQPYQHYHYIISDYFNTFANHNFSLEKIVEPNGFEITQDTGMNSDTPTFLIMKFKKLNR